MIPFTLVLIAVGFAVACRLCFYFAAYALPLLCAVLAGRWAFDTGAGLFSALIVAIAAFAFAVVMSQLAAMAGRPLWVRIVIFGLTIIPAAAISYLFTTAILEGLVPSAIWRFIFTIIVTIAASTGAVRRLYPFHPAA